MPATSSPAAALVSQTAGPRRIAAGALMGAVTRAGIAAVVISAAIRAFLALR